MKVEPFGNPISLSMMNEKFLDVGLFLPHYCHVVEALWEFNSSMCKGKKKSAYEN